MSEPTGPHHRRAAGPLPAAMRRLEEADLQGIIHGECGDTMEIYLRLSGGHIQDAAFLTDGGASIIACGVALTDMVRGKTLEAARQIAPADVLDAVGGLAPAKVHCATLAVRALHAAVGGEVSA